jgi:four helix bundle protein
MNYKGYKELDSYIESRNLRIAISNLVKTFPNKERFLLIDQLIRSSRSITANIAEGYGRFTYSDTRNFFIISRGSVTETMEHLQTAKDENYISEDEYRLHIEKCETIFKLINGYISYLDKSKQKSSSK